MKADNLYVVIPAYNPPSETFPLLISEIRKTLPNASIVVIDDGSSPRYNMHSGESITLVRHQENLGKGEALKSGFRIALENEADAILTIDADGQHKPKEAVKLINRMVDDNFDMVIGSRMAGSGCMPWHRALSNKITSKLISWRIGMEIEDSQSGFRLIGGRVLKILKVNTSRFDFESEFLIKAGLHGYRIGFADIATIYGDETSSMKAVDVFRFIKLYISSFFWTKTSRNLE